MKDYNYYKITTITILQLLQCYNYYNVTTLQLLQDYKVTTITTLQLLQYVSTYFRIEIFHYYNITRLQHNIIYSNYQSVTTLQELQDETCVEIREAISSITVLQLTIHVLFIDEFTQLQDYKISRHNAT